MRPILLLTFSFCCICFSDYAQSPISFHLLMKPGTLYDETMQRRMKVSMNYDSANQAMKEAMESNPQIASMLKLQQSLMEIGTHLGKAGADGVMPVHMEIKTDTGGMLAQLLPAGTIFYGRAKPGSLPEYDSLNKEVPGVPKEAILSAMKSMSAQISFPDTVLSVGQSYTQVIPIDIPAGPMTLKMNFTQVYTLTGYSADTAGFDIKANGTLDMGGESMAVPITGGGGGWGHMVYDRKKNYYRSLKMDVTMKMEIKQAGAGMEIVTHTVEMRNCVVKSE